MTHDAGGLLPPEEIHTLIGAYALDALEPDEREAFERHLDDCPECREEATGLAEAAAEWGESLAATPPESMRAHVLDEVARTPQAPPFPHAPERMRARVMEAVDSDARRGRRRVVPTWLVGVAAGFAFLATVAVGGLLLRPAPEHEVVSMEQDVMMTISAPDAVTADLELGSAHVVCSEKMDSVVAMGTDAPMPDEGMEYQLWLVMDDGTMEPGPTFMPEDGEFMTYSKAHVADLDHIMVSIEPAGGSAQPSGEVVAEATV